MRFARDQLAPPHHVLIHKRMVESRVESLDSDRSKTMGIVLQRNWEDALVDSCWLALVVLGATFYMYRGCTKIKTCPSKVLVQLAMYLHVSACLQSQAAKMQHVSDEQVMEYLRHTWAGSQEAHIQTKANIIMRAVATSHRAHMLATRSHVKPSRKHEPRTCILGLQTHWRMRRLASAYQHIDDVLLHKTLFHI